MAKTKSKWSNWRASSVEEAKEKFRKRQSRPILRTAKTPLQESDAHKLTKLELVVGKCYPRPMEAEKEQKRQGSEGETFDRLRGPDAKASEPPLFQGKRLSDDPTTALLTLRDALDEMGANQVRPVAQQYLEFLASKYPLKKGRPSGSSSPVAPFGNKDALENCIVALESLSARLGCPLLSEKGAPVRFSSFESGALGVIHRTAPCGSVSAGMGFPKLHFASGSGKRE